MVMTILEGRVSAARWSELEIAYKRGLKTVPVALLQTFLIQDTRDRELWRIITLWKSEDAYLESRSKGIHSTCEDMFRSVDVEPSRRVFKPVAHHMTV